MDLDNAPLPELIVACLESGKADAWTELIRRLHSVFARVVYRVASDWRGVLADEIDDIVQEICIKLGARGADALRRAPRESAEAVLAYFKVMAANHTRDHFKAKYAEKRGQNQTLSMDAKLEELAQAIEGESRIERGVLLAQVDDALPVGRERTIFWLYYRHGFTTKEIAGVSSFGLTAKGVESLVHRLTISVRERLEGGGKRAGGKREGKSATGSL